MKYVKLDKLCDITMGQSPDSSSYNDKGIGLPFFQGKSEFGKIYPTAKMYCTEPKKTAQPLDILMSVRAPVGDVNISNIDCCIGRGLCSIRCKNNINYKYIYYYLLTQKKVLESQSTGSTFKAINKSIVSELEIPLQDLDAQYKIVEILDKAQELIDKRKEQIELLDELVQSRFIEMFGNININSKNWDIKKLSDTINIIGGYAFKSTEFVETGIPVLKIGNINSGYFKNTNLMFWEEDEKLERYLIKPGDLVMSLTGTVGKDDYGNVCIMGNEYNKYYLNQRNAKLDVIDEKVLSKIYLTYSLKVPEIKKRLTGISRGVRQANISNKDILSLELPVPPLALQEEFADFAGKVNDIKAVLNKSLEQLNNNFDSLINRAFKGELF